MKLSRKIKIYRMRENAKVPVRAHSTDAGMDVFWSPSGKKDFNVGWVVLKPGQSHVFETGLKIEVPPNYMLQVMNKSGIASKKSLVAGACVIDSGYDGEIFINLHNIGNKDQYIEPGQKLAQLVMIPVITPELVEILEDNVYEFETSRGTGGFGSTGDN